MQTSLQTVASVQVSLSAPVELSFEQLQQVVGGLGPNGSWAAASLVEGPNGNWAVAMGPNGSW